MDYNVKCQITGCCQLPSSSHTPLYCTTQVSWIPYYFITHDTDTYGTSDAWIIKFILHLTWSISYFVCNFLSLCTAHTPCPIFVNLELLPPLTLENTAMSLPFTDNSTTLDHILNQMNLMYILTPYLFKIHYNIIVPFMCSSWNWSLCFKLSDTNFTCISHLHVNACQATCLITLIILRWQQKLWKPHWPVVLSFYFFLF